MYKFIYEPDNEYGIDCSLHSVTMKIEQHADLQHMLDNFECFLKACGYSFRGDLDLVENETTNSTETKDTL